MKRFLTLTFVILSLCVTGVVAQEHGGTTGTKAHKTAAKRGPVFKATKDQINQAQALLKSKGLYGGEQLGKLDEATRTGLRKYQEAEGIRITGTLNKITLEKMSITLTEKQKQM